MANSPPSTAKIDVSTLANLSNLTVSSEQAKKLEEQFVDTLKVVDQLSKLDTKNIDATPQVTNQKNVFRSDELNPHTLLTQGQALSNAAKTHNGYFVVPRVGKSEE